MITSQCSFEEWLSGFYALLSRKSGVPISELKAAGMDEIQLREQYDRDESVEDAVNAEHEAWEGL